ANVSRQHLRSVTSCAVANLPFELAVLDREQFVLRAKGPPDLLEHSMQQRATIDRLDAETDAWHPLRAQSNLCLRPERTARLQLHRLRPASCLARGERRCTIVSKRVQRRPLIEQHATQRSCRTGRQDLLCSAHESIEQRTACEMDVLIALRP